MLQRTMACALTALLGLSLSARAQDEKPKAEPTVDRIEALNAASTLVHLGREKKAPEMLLAAARVIGLTDLNKVDTKDAKLESATSDSDALAEAKGLITEAEGLAQGKDKEAVKALGAMILDQISEVKRGALGGPRSITGRVDAKYDKTDTYFIDFKGKAVAAISVANLSNRGDIDLYVYSLDNKLIKRDFRKNASAYVSFLPASNTRVRVVVRAYAGATPLLYRLTTN